MHTVLIFFTLFEISTSKEGGDKGGALDQWPFHVGQLKVPSLSGAVVEGSLQGIDKFPGTLRNLFLPYGISATDSIERGPERMKAWTGLQMFERTEFKDTENPKTQNLKVNFQLKKLDEIKPIKQFIHVNKEDIDFEKEVKEEKKRQKDMFIALLTSLKDTTDVSALEKHKGGLLGLGGRSNDYKEVLKEKTKNMIPPIVTKQYLMPITSRSANVERLNTGGFFQPQAGRMYKNVMPDQKIPTVMAGKVLPSEKDRLLIGKYNSLLRPRIEEV